MYCDDIMDVENSAKRALLVFSIEKVLMKMGQPEYDLVVARLKNEYDCFLVNCVENPQYLKRILEDVYGNAYDDILREIRKEFGEFASQRYYSDFLVAMSR
ncbi:MAG: hypothetical protein QXE84_06975 [Candidatus Nitrosotenuis sp.]|uniref:Uncharacterized protein n=2 Tax=Candidatus Nitrosotenuis uzonensis TaxID=1407055 RepID=A0A812F4J5_9ARCH|nr:conserved hypothetical protein [Candidatus Nitrosotenuis uzonensis]